MMKLRNVLVLAGLVSMFAAPAAMAGVSLSVVGVGNLSMPSSVAGTLLPAISGLSGGMGFGGGALISLPIAPMVGLEFGGIYHTSKISTDASNFGGAAGVTDTFTSSTLEVPVSVKIMLGHMFFVNVGGYATTFIGAPSGSDSNGATLTTSGWGDLGQNTLNYGLLGGLGLNLPLGTSMALRAEALYEFQLDNSYNSTVKTFDSAASFKYNAVEFRVGLTFGGGMSSR